jgi:universal stress protein family protein
MIVLPPMRRSQESMIEAPARGRLRAPRRAIGPLPVSPRPVAVVISFDEHQAGAARGRQYSLAMFHPHPASSFQRILVPIDGSPTADRGLDEAIRLAALSGGSLRLLHVLDADQVRVPCVALANDDVCRAERKTVIGTHGVAAKLASRVAATIV